MSKWTSTYVYSEQAREALALVESGRTIWNAKQWAKRVEGRYLAHISEPVNTHHTAFDWTVQMDNGLYLQGDAKSIGAAKQAVEHYATLLGLQPQPVAWRKGGEVGLGPAQGDEIPLYQLKAP